MVIKADTRYKLKKVLKELRPIRGRGTELVTVYCPHDYDIQEIINQLREEEAEAENIKSKRTRKNVKSALSKMVERLQSYPRTPDNGVAVFCGNVSEKEGKTDVKIWDIEPPEPVRVKLYRCGKEFVLDNLEQMLEETESYGMLVIDTSEADIGVLKGKRVEPKQHIESMVPGKSKPGGQSAQRFERVRRGLLDDYLKNVSERIKSVFDLDELKGLLIGGPGPLKEKLVNDDYLPKKVQDKIIAVESTSYTGQQGFEELLERSQEQLQETKMQKERELMKKFFNELREGGKVAYGLESVLRSIKLGAAEKLLMSEEVDFEAGKFVCDCGWQGVKLYEGEKLECPECGLEIEPEEDRGVFEVLEEKIENIGGEIVVVSRDTREGEQLYQMGGIAALLRFKIE